MEFPEVPDFQSFDDVTRWFKDYLAGTHDNTQKDLETKINRMLTEKHAPILIPQVSIDPNYAQKNLTAASAAATWTAIGLPNTSSTTNNSFTTAVSYTGRGILTICVLAEVTSAGVVNRNIGARITIDGNVVYTATNAVTRQSAIRTIIGGQIEIAAGTGYAIIPSHPGLPFNSTCLIEIIGNASGDTATVGWQIAKKL